MPEQPIFLIGAGFNREAHDETGPIYGESLYIGKYQIKCSYPLVHDLAKECFPEDPYDGHESIETKFERACSQGNTKPLGHLCDLLMKADYYLAPVLSNTENAYSAFFERFRGSSFITYNYDSMVEYFLFRKQCWYPHDGFGIPVETSQTNGDASPPKSTSLVLHLHGSLCVYSHSFDVQWTGNFGELRPTAPRYYFDPDSIGNLFFNYRRSVTIGHRMLEERVIAPVPNKSKALDEPFVRATHSRANELLKSGGRLVSIGYRFNSHDDSSYDCLLGEFSRTAHPEVLLIGPDAEEIKRRLSLRYKRIRWIATTATFSQWVRSGFRGV